MLEESKESGTSAFIKGLTIQGSLRLHLQTIKVTVKEEEQQRNGLY